MAAMAATFIVKVLVRIPPPHTVRTLASERVWPTLCQTSLASQGVHTRRDEMHGANFLRLTFHPGEFLLFGRMIPPDDSIGVDVFINNCEGRRASTLAER